MSDRKVNFDFGVSLDKFMQNVQRTLVEQSGYRGMGGHALEDTAPHGPHSQVDIGIDNTTVGFRSIDIGQP